MHRGIDIALGAVAVATAIGLGWIAVSNGDTGFHLATGRWVLEHRAIPSTNVLSFTQPEHPWVAHEWLSGVLFEWSWRAGGPLGLLLLKAVLIGATFALVYAASRRLGADPLRAAVATSLAAWASESRLVERPQIFTLAAIAAVVWLTARMLASFPRRRWQWAAAAGAVVVADYQLHAGAINLTLLLLLASLGAWLEPRRARWAGRADSTAAERRDARDLDHRRAWLLLATAIGAVAASGLLLLAYHPAGLGPLWVPFELGADPALRSHVIEYRPPHTFPFVLLLFYWVMVFGVVLSLLGHWRRIHAVWLVVVLSFLGLSLHYVRMVGAFAVVSAPLLAAVLSAPSRLPRTERLRRTLGRVTALAALLVWVAAVPMLQWSRRPVGPGLNRRIWPTDLFQVVRDQRLAGPAFVSDGWAGPFLAEFFPEERAFFDPRFEAYSREFVLQVYRKIRDGEAGWDQLLERYGIELVLLKHTSPGEARRQQGRPNLRQRLLEHRDWSLVAFNDHGALYARRAGPNGAQAEQLSVTGVDPDRGEFTGRPAAAAHSLRALLARGSRDNQVLVMAAVAMADAGEVPAAQALLAEASAKKAKDPRIAEARRMIEGR